MINFGIVAMNYQPYLDMHVLLSDQLLQELQGQKPAIALLLLLTILAIYFVSTAIYSALKLLRAPNRPYPAHESLTVVDK